MSAKEIEGKSEGHEITIELAVFREENGLKIANQNVMFHPAKKTLRGRWETRNLPPGTTALNHDGALLTLEEIPGMHIALNPVTGAARIYDPLGLPQNAKLWEQCKGVARSCFGNNYKPAETIKQQLGKDQVATWYYWMKRLVDEGSARLVPGSSWLASAPAGRIKVNVHDSGGNAKRFLHEFAEQEAA